MPEFLSSHDRVAPIFQEFVANYERIAHDDLAQSIQPAYVLVQMADRIMDCLGELRGRRVCDVGVGQGILLRRMRDAGASEVTGVDIAIDYLRHFAGAEGMRVAIANAENLPFREEFDLVVAADVFEHVLNPADFLVSARDALVDGGLLVVRVPHREDLTQYAHRNGCGYDLVHLRNFTRDSLVDVLQRAGFSVEGIQYDGFYSGRLRRPIARSRVGRYFFDLYVRRVLGDDRRTIDLNPWIGRLLMTPSAITATSRKA